MSSARLFNIFTRWLVSNQQIFVLPKIPTIENVQKYYYTVFEFRARRRQANQEQAK